MGTDACVTRFSLLHYVVSYHFTCLPFLSNHAMAGLKADCVLIFFVMLAVQTLDLHLGVLEQFLQVLLEWRRSRENARAGNGQQREKE